LKAKEVEETARADDLLEQVRNLQAHALDILEHAEKVGDLRTALAVISQARGILLAHHLTTFTQTMKGGAN
jgi:hypothetical protein